MSESTSHNGGMCANPFGGEERIDRINLLEFLGSNTLPEKVLFTCIIQDAVSNYLYAFLGKNGTSAEEFFSAWQYFFNVISTNKASWGHSRTIKQSYINRGKKIKQNHYLTDSEIQMMCFDRHYEMGGLANYMHIDKFRAGLKAKRRKILTQNWNQVQTYINYLHQHEMSQIANGQQVPLEIWHSEDLLSVLVDPSTPLHLAHAIYVPNRLKRPRKPRLRPQSNIGMYTKLVSRLRANDPPPLDNWGPLSELGENDVQVARRDISNCIYSNPS